MNSPNSLDADKIGALRFSIVNRTRKQVPRIPFEQIKEKVLGNRYELSLVFCGDHLMRKLNRTYRDKDRTTNVLSFHLSNYSGEIFINPSRSAPFGVGKLFIHGLLHLKGMQHGAKMERAEDNLSRIFLSSNTNGTTNSYRHRYRHRRNQGGHRRRVT